MENTAHAIEQANEATIALLTAAGVSDRVIESIKRNGLAPRVWITRTLVNGVQKSTRSHECAYTSKEVDVLIGSGQYVLIRKEARMRYVSEEYLSVAEARRLRDLLNNANL